MIGTWKNGAQAKEVKSVIDSNFQYVAKDISRNIRAYTESQISNLTEKAEGLIVFNTTTGKWLQNIGGNWVNYMFPVANTDNAYSMSIGVATWENGNISIPFTAHGITNPCVKLYITHNGVYTEVLGGVVVDDIGNITLSTDMPFAGRVVVK